VLGRSHLLERRRQLIGQFDRSSHTKTVLLPYGRDQPATSGSCRVLGTPANGTLAAIE
jgi:hypothetical protein